MPTNLTIHANTDDLSQDLPLGTSGVEFTQIDADNDFVIISNGTVGVVDDGEVVPGENELNQAGFILQGVEIISDKHFVADISDDELKEMRLMGNLDSQYVLAFDFDGPTASEPVLEVWDDSSLSSINNVSLGAGVPNNSWFRGIVTTNGSSGAPGWAGSRLAGASSGNFLFLNDQNGPLVGADTLYANLKVVIPPTANTSGAETPVFVIKFTTN